METLVQSEQQQQPLTNNHLSVTPLPESQPASENAPPCAAGSKLQLFYKCLLNEHAQKLRKPRPVYQTVNEGVDHLPMFRSTVLFDGASYTSPNTFQQRKMAEMDASKTAYIAIIQKLKSDALRFIREDGTFSKSILVEYGAKYNVGKPEYETTNLVASLPVFRSSVRFNGVTYIGDNGRSKKEAEYSAARAVIQSYLDSESGTDMAEIINCKSRYLAELYKVHETNSAQDGANVLGTQTGVGNEIASTVAKPEPGTGTIAKSSAVPEPVLAQVTTVPATFPSSSATPPPIPQALIKPITPAVAVVTQPPVPEVPVDPIKPAVAVVTQPPVPEVPVDPIKPAVPVSEVLEQTASTEVKNASFTYTLATAPLLSTPATDISSVAIQPAHSDVAALEYIPLTGQSSERKRNRRSKRNAKKKMRIDAQIPMAPASQVPIFPSQ